ncbi:hypothetical protein [Algoriphagus hitonicola]|uniref:Uncharacterized protein n=1 Tax=Algoriphagus hitonicola TaxID=435880 RepID=A0A1I2UNE2_9BACT|nr:hypothetical protein [Algoriphagus hitonicola]SFG78665.1 hypothetical protein SAMN04487988_10844 [Algoriphagus hitonicola]
MKTIALKIKSSDISKYGLEDVESVNFNELVDKISRDLALESLKIAQKYAKATDLSKLTLDEIKAEVQEFRNESSS